MHLLGIGVVTFTCPFCYTETMAQMVVNAPPPQAPAPTQAPTPTPPQAPTPTLVDEEALEAALEALKVHYRENTDTLADEFRKEYDDLMGRLAEKKAMKAMVAKEGRLAEKTATKAKKAMKGGKSITKRGIAQALATACALRKSDCLKVLSALSEVVIANLKKTGTVIIPGIARMRTHTQPATKAGTHKIFGKMCFVKALPARTVVKVFPAQALAVFGVV
jgi:nucleoid DNA-binding protein